MPPLCLTLHVHQSARLKHYSFFDIGNATSYEDEPRTVEALNHLVSDCLLPAQQIILKRLKDYNGDFRIALSVPGLLLDLFERYKPEMLDGFKALSDTGHVEFLVMPYCHSLASEFSLQEFREQVLLHHERIQALTGRVPTTFSNTALIYRDDLAREMESMGYHVMVAAGSVRLLGKRSPNHVYRPAGCSTLKLLVNNDGLSDDLARRFTRADSPDTPPTPTGFARWLRQGGHSPRGGLFTLTLPLEPFARRDRDDTGLFQFLDKLPEAVLLQKGGHFLTPSEAVSHRSSASLSSANTVSDTGPDHDLSPWTGNEMQKDALNALYLLEPKIKGCQDRNLLLTWRQLQESDHFLFMNTRREVGNGTGHPANPHGSPYDAYINFMNIVTDFSERIPV